MTGPQTAGEALGSGERSGLRPRGLGWLMWRQHRLAAWLWLAAVLAALVGFLLLRSAMVDFIDGHHIAGCAEISDVASCQQPSTQQAVEYFRAQYGELLKGIGALLLLLPALLGVLVGAPLLSREWESGTWKLVLAQQVTVRRWLVAKMLTIALLCGLGSAVLMGLFHWLWLPSANEVSGISWFSMTFVVSGGPVLVATVLLALAVGMTVGALLRQVVPAMGTTLVLVVALQYGLSVLRPYLWGWHTELVSMSELPNSTWGIAQGFLRADGTRLPYDMCSPGNTGFPECASGGSAGLREFTDVHHAADYWPLQLVESGICLVLVAALVVFTLRWTDRRSG
ncbi:MULTISPECIES: ABC transporter permease [unclassified Kitasatospora]|uniref:ABC transporter permease n=1 Tax=unclassified Kitasatospora TaxID=2633591 RepID=UPI0024757460|nr:ABC transporter permease subunit [Kitasatospora sp. MAP12-44]